ncbi:MAG: helix-turn-helix domain-containing protein [Syntrophobacteraceae bacterium]
MKTIGDRIKHIRKANGLDLVEFSAFIGVSRTTVSRWERGVNYPTSDMLQAILKLGGISSEWLLVGEGMPPNETCDAQDSGCPKCGSRSRMRESSDNFCITCGADLREYHVQCQGCGFSTMNPMNYCVACGHPYPKERPQV